MPFRVERLKINFKTLDEFKKFREYGLQELSMLEDLQANMIENDSDSPFYGIYDGDALVARMSLYLIDAKYDRYFDPPQAFHELMKLEVLPAYRGRGLGSMLVEHAKRLGRPIKTNARLGSDPFWKKLGFVPVKYDAERDRGENPYVWLPEGVRLAVKKPH
ncbi:MAG: N-acetyltransferase [Hydrogenibacillus sp.]|nr:N-acetyltransferase [Hydrogenibacillus sp.]